MQQATDDAVNRDMETGVTRKDIQVLITATLAPANTLAAVIEPFERFLKTRCVEQVRVGQFHRKRNILLAGLRQLRQWELAVERSIKDAVHTKGALSRLA